MEISVSHTPTSNGTYRYNVFHRGRGTYGFRKTRVEARAAAEEDGQLLHTCAAMEAQARDAEEREEATA